MPIFPIILAVVLSFFPRAFVYSDEIDTTKTVILTKRVGITSNDSFPGSERAWKIKSYLVMFVGSEVDGTKVFLSLENEKSHQLHSRIISLDSSKQLLDFTTALNSGRIKSLYLMAAKKELPAAKTIWVTFSGKSEGKWLREAF